MPFRPINILIAHESPLLRSVLSASMSRDAAFDEIRTAGSFAESASVLKVFHPDVIIAGENLAGEETDAIVRDSEIPMVVVAGPGANPSDYPGAADFILLPKEPEDHNWAAFCSEVCVKAKIAAVPGSIRAPRRQKLPSSGGSDRVILIGASTGGTDATAEIVRNLPDDLPGIAIVQHMPSGFTKMYAQRLDGISKLRISEAKDGDRVERGTALIAPGGLHMLLRKDSGGYYVHCVQGERVNGHCPSVGVLFDSAAKEAGSEAVGVLLTGMGKDGAEGLLHMRQAGAYTIGQDRATCVVYGMPMVAYELGAVVDQAPLQRIADLIVQHVK